MYFQHSKQIWTDFPELAAGAVVARGITADVDVTRRVAALVDTALTRLAAGPESELAEIQAWRRTFAKMGLKPTQYRCASESLLRRLRKERALPAIHPLIDLCNAVSVAFAVPVAVFDVARICDGVEVRYAVGDETYQTFSGETERPGPGEVIFADDAGRAHARRWTNRQSGHSAVRDGTATVLIVAEAMHEAARSDIKGLTATIERQVASTWSITPAATLLGQSEPRFEFLP